jgi:O-antigen ligase
LPAHLGWLWLLPLMIVGLVFGGASQGAPLQRLAVELVSLPYIALALQRMRLTDLSERVGFAVLSAVFAVPLIQLLPLPPSLWVELPGRAAVAESLSLAGAPLGWAPLTLTPGETVRSFTFLLYPAAVVLTARQLAPEAARGLVAATLGLTLLSLLLSGLQAVGPIDNPLYFYGASDTASAPGLFANHNHQASLLLAAAPLSAGLALGLSRTGENGRAGMVMLAAALGLLLVGLAVTRSRAGVLLAAPALLGALAVLWRGSASGRRVGLAAPVVIGVLVAGGLVYQMGLRAILERFETPAAVDARFSAIPAELEAARTYFPAGAGLGSFQRAYQAVEPLETLEPTFLNQAHNEYLEILIETGVLGSAVAVAFLGWYVLAASRVWASPSRQAHLARAATIVIGVLLAHSAVDYPLRTHALAGVFALACGLLWQGAAQVSEERARARASR